MRAAHEASIDVSAHLDREVKTFVESAAGAGAGVDDTGAGAGAGAGSVAPSAITFELYGGVGGAEASSGPGSLLPRLEARLTELERRVGAGSQAAERLRGGTVLAALEEVRGRHPPCLCRVSRLLLACH